MPFIDKNSENIVKGNTLRENSSKPKIEFELIDPKYKLTDLVVSDETYEKIEDAVALYTYMEKLYVDWGLSHVLNNSSKMLINLYGESGTGKTMAAHAIAHQLSKKIVFVNYFDIESKYVGETSKNLYSLFSFGMENDAIILFDEADAMLSKRVTNMSNSTDVSVNQTRSVLLNILNDYNNVVIFTTNFISNFDTAFMRRINFHIKFELPNIELRKLLWKKYIPNTMPANANIEKLAKDYEGINGADIANAVLMAALSAARRREESVCHEYFENSIKNIIKSKNDNNQNVVSESIYERVVSEDYALSQIKK